MWTLGNDGLFRNNDWRLRVRIRPSAPVIMFLRVGNYNGVSVMIIILIKGSIYTLQSVRED